MEPEDKTDSKDASTNINDRNDGTTESRRSAIRSLIERYFYQLIRGCGNPTCTNVNCFSSGKVTPMSPNEAAGEALKLFSQDARICFNHNQTLRSQGLRSGRSGTEATERPLILSSSANSSRTSNSTSASTSGSSSRRTSNTSPLAITGQNSTTTSANSSNARPNGFFLELEFNSDQTANSNLRQLQLHGSAESGDGGDLSRLNNESNVPRLRFMDDSSKLISSTLEQQQNSMPLSTPFALHRSSENENTSDESAFHNEKCSTQTRALLATYLNETLIDEFIKQGKEDGEFDLLLHAINSVFSSIDKLSQSFKRSNNLVLKGTTSTTETKLQDILGKSPSDLKKEDLRSMESENEKDEDSTQCNHVHYIDNDQTAAITPLATIMETEETTSEEASTSAQLTAALFARSTQGSDLSINDDYDDDSTSDTSDMEHLKGTNATLVDLESLRRVKSKLAALNEPVIGETLNSNIILIAETIKFQNILWDWEHILHCLIICFDLIIDTSNNLIDFELLEYSLPKLCQAVRSMHVEPQARLARIWSVHCKDQLHPLVHCCQQLISLNAIVDEAEVQENLDVVAATIVLKIAYYASIMAGEVDPPRNPILSNIKESEGNTFGAFSRGTQKDEENELFSFNFDSDSPKIQYPRFADDDLAKVLNLRAIYCRTPVVPFDEFYNEPLSDNIQMDRDYLCYKKILLDSRVEELNFSFMLYSFILTPATKVVGLYYDSRIRMYSERHQSMYSTFGIGFLNGDGIELNSAPELNLKIRRENIVNDALVGLELLALSNPKNLKKQLVIEFVGEQGVDEGGVSKEFFQLIVDEIFNADFGMFVEMEETQRFWFNSMSFENDAQFTLIGIIIGLAIYNSIILAVRFPMVVYRKLMGAEGSFYDLKDFSPTLYRSLQSLIDYMDDDMEDVFLQTFKISYKNVFGDIVEHELMPGGAEITVNQTNKQDFVDLYADFLLNRSIERQFEAFKKGFEMVTAESPLRLLFRPEEVELLVCGSKKFDFAELEKSTEYEGGYTKDTQIIKYFWEIVHSMPEESKRKLLEFTTGSDRVPVGGLSRLKLLITRQGPDCDRLPTAHTCFNILLLPEYSSKEKLEVRLLKAITYSKGFGML